MSEPVRTRSLTDQEGQRLRQIMRRARHESIRFRRATIVMASSSGTPVLAIARLVAADEDTVRDVIHAYNERGLACLDPKWAGGRPRLIHGDDEEFIAKTALTRPAKLGRPFTHWSIRKLADYLATDAARTVRIGREQLRQILHACGISFQRTGPGRSPATYHHRTHGIRYFHACYSLRRRRHPAAPAVVQRRVFKHLGYDTVRCYEDAPEHADTETIAAHSA